MTGMRRWSLALLGAIALVALSCGEPSPVGVSSTPPPSQGDVVTESFSHLLSCSPLPADSVTQTIGPEGGTLQVGPHYLSIPAGALAAPVAITAVMPSARVNSVQFQPAGLIFNQPAYLSMSYANCGLLPFLLPKRIAYTTDALQILEYLLSIDHWRVRRVTGRVEHFSTYAVAW